MGNTGAMPGATLWGQGLFGGPIGTVSTALAVSDLIYAGYRNAGILSAPGRSYSAEEVVDGLLILNSMIDGLNAEQLAVYSISRRLFDLTSAQQDYTIGTGGNFDVSRPPRIQMAGALLNINPKREIPVKVLSVPEWASIAGKEIADVRPRALYYDRGIAIGTVYVWPVPTVASAYPKLVLYLWSLLTPFENSSDTVILPYGYRHFLELELGVELAIRNPNRAKLDPKTVAMAADAKKAIQAMNATLWS
jgi:hypothetical protein